MFELWTFDRRDGRGGRVISRNRDLEVSKRLADRLEKIHTDRLYDVRDRGGKVVYVPPLSDAYVVSGDGFSQ
jgi:hypothetical protein